MGRFVTYRDKLRRERMFPPELKEVSAETASWSEKELSERPNWMRINGNSKLIEKLLAQARLEKVAAETASSETASEKPNWMRICGGKSKRIEQETPVEEKGKKRRKMRRNKKSKKEVILRNNIDQLIAQNSPKMSKKQRKWISIYNHWLCSPKCCGRRIFRGGCPPMRKSWDPKACTRMKFRDDEDLDPFVARVAEMAMQFYNKNHEGSDFEVVEILSANMFLYIHQWIHINFRAKPKNASAADGRSFFAEHFYDDFDPPSHESYEYRRKITEGVISTCCLVEEGSTTNDSCGYCPTARKVLHPINDGFVFHPDGTFKVSA